MTKKEKPEIKPVEIEIGQEFLELKYENPMYVLNYKIDDIDNDTKNDMIIVVGEKSGDIQNGISNFVGLAYFL